MLSAITVTTLSDAVTHAGVSLRDAITQANSDPAGDTITFANSLIASGPATITLDYGNLSITNAMTITGLGANQLAIDGNHLSEIFNVSGAKNLNVTITGLTLQNGETLGYGGAIGNSGNLTLHNDTITNNVADDGGGGIFNSGTLTSLNNAIENNAAADGGGIENTGTLTSTNDTLFNNSSIGTGYTFGGCVFNSGTMSVTNDTITSNTGIGIDNYTGGTLTSTNDTIDNNSGSGIANYSTLTSTNDTIDGNSATYGGGVANYGTLGMLTTVNDTIANNTVPYSNTGGGVYDTGTWNSLNTIVTAHINGGAVVNSGTINSQYTLIGDKSVFPSGNGNILNPANQNILVTDPSGKPWLTNNGGPTLTVGLATGSPATGPGGSLGHVTATGDSNGTTLAVDNITFIAVGDSLKIGSEIVLVTAVTAGTGTAGTLTVLRHQGGTTQSNLDSQSIILAYDQRGTLRSLNDLGAVEGTGTFSQVTPTINVIDKSGIANGSPFAASATVTANGATITSPAVTYSFYYLSDTTFTNPLPSAPTNAGSYVAVAHYAGNADYGAVQGSVAFTIADPMSKSIVVNTISDLSDSQLPAGSVTLRDAITAANNTLSGFTTITFAPSLTANGPATITLTQGELDITNSMTITGIGASQLAVDGGYVANSSNVINGSRIFDLTGPTNLNVAITGLTLQNGNDFTGYGGGAIYNNENLTLNHDIIENNGTGSNTGGGSNGGGIFNAAKVSSTNDTIENNSNTVYSHVVVNGNYGLGSGGGIYNQGTFLSTNDVIQNNSANNDSAGGGGNGGGIDNVGTWISTNDTISGNTAGAAGGSAGGVFNNGTMISTNDTIEGSDSGGIINTATLSTTNDLIENNANGGGVSNGGTWTSTGDTIANNADNPPPFNYEPVYGGGITNFSGVPGTVATAILTNDTIEGNSVGNGYGAGIYNAGTLTSTNDTIANNMDNGSYFGGGGGIYNGGTFTSTNDTIANNTATYSYGGGGIENSGTLTTTNDTIANNTSTLAGGGVGDGGGVYNFSTWNAANTIIAANLGGDVLNVSGTITAQNSLVGDNSVFPSGNGNILNPANQSIFVTSGGIPLLANNGGPTQTIALASGSPAIGTGGALGHVTSTGNNGTTLSVDDIAFVTVGDMLKIGSEIVLVNSVTAGTGTTGTLTVQRALGGTRSR
jgi:hypothetical protein